MNGMKNIIAIIDGQVNVFHAMEEVTEAEIVSFIEKVAKKPVEDIYEEKDSMLQYYCIDGRICIDTPEKVARMRKAIEA